MKRSLLILALIAIGLAGLFALPALYHSSATAPTPYLGPHRHQDRAPDGSFTGG